MAEELSNLKKQRAICKGSITRIESFVNGFNHETHSIRDVRVRLEHLIDLWKNYQTLQDKIVLHDGSEEGHIVEVENKYFNVRSKIEELLQIGNTINTTQVTSHESRPPIIKLPTIKLPTFSGEYTEWVHYRDVFQSLIIENAALTEIQKFHYLISSLSKDVGELIANIPPTSTNFKIAWDLLFKRFNSPKVIVQEHVKKLLNIPKFSKESIINLSTIVNKVRSNVNAIKSITEITTPTDELIISQIILNSIDHITRRAWELHAADLTQFSLEELLKFVEGKIHALESINSTLNSPNKGDIHKTVSSRVQTSSLLTTQSNNNNSCVWCKQKHTIQRCPVFTQLTIKEKLSKVQDNRLCFNCLNKGHRSNNCKSKYRCKKCGRRHHTSLHAHNVNDSEPNKGPVQDVNEAQSPFAIQKENPNDRIGTTQVPNTTCCSFKMQPQVLLATVLVQVRDCTGQLHQCRALLDNASQTNFITESLVNQLSLKKHSNNLPIQGISESQVCSRNCVTVTLSSRYSSYMRTISCAVLKKITGETPQSHIEVKSWNVLNEFKLADPSFNNPGPIDLLIGAELFFEILKPTSHVHVAGLPALIDTEFGWILSGQFTNGISGPQTKQKRTLLSRCDDLHSKLQTFWEIEEISNRIITKSEKLAEDHFRQHTVRNNSGRYVVRLPMKEDSSKLGESHHGALRRLLNLEKRFIHNPKLREDYVKFMEEYEQLEHMKIVNAEEEIDTTKTYYLPHHPVIKEGSSTTKTRVVFDASFRTTSGLSLNDTLLVGPTIQHDLFSILLRFRTHKVCFTADIEKMYRQIQVHEEDTPLQRILWRKDPKEPISKYELKTVTYGTASAPFLAVRCLHQLAEDEEERFPQAARVIMHDMYVDDCISGAETIEEAIKIQEELIKMLFTAGFHLRKWASNHSEILESVSEADRETQFPLRFEDEENIRTLGLLWYPASDKFHISHSLIHKSDSITKRSILSTIAGIFDPLGLISPVVIECKIFMQELWQSKLGWNDELPTELSQQWLKIYSELFFIKNLSIDRYVLLSGQRTLIQVHGFADASERAYGCCLYLRTVNLNGCTEVRLLCSKSRVAPIKRISVPRLELCAAVLLARLTKKVINSINLQIDDTYLWSDSTIALSWIAASPSRWKTFVANRVTEIQQLTESAHWVHITTNENPADLISRGASPRLLKDNCLWWVGPNFLHDSQLEISDFKPSQTLHKSSLLEQRGNLTLSASEIVEWDLINKYSSLGRLQRVVAYCIRFCNNCRKGDAKLRATSCLSSSELRTALSSIIGHVQKNYYSKELAALQADSPLPLNSRIIDLNPFIDKNGYLRVGGRLQNSVLDYDNQFQLILPHDHHLTKLIIRAEHIKLLHAGQKLLVSSLRQRFWIPKLRSVLRQVIGKCLICFKLKASAAKQLMGTLPAHRVQPSRAFSNCGVDYAGPIMLRAGSARSKVTIKAYIAVFVCMATKAVHLEVVSNLSSDAFIAALRRFISRRGRIQNLYSDNGTNFIGARNHLKDLYKLLRESHDKFGEFAAEEGFSWHCIPPSAPHFGGLWEAAVKSMKYHLIRVVGNQRLTFEELVTLSCQIESCLNSRPLTPLSDTPHEGSFLTPGHFLIGDNLSALPDPDYASVSVNRLKRWQQLQQLIQNVWKRWSTDYLHNLQQRTKWRTRSQNLSPGTLVLIKENTPPLQWRTAIVESVHPGEDGLVRVAIVKTTSGLMKRPISKLCPFPE